MNSDSKQKKTQNKKMIYKQFAPAELVKTVLDGCVMGWIAMSCDGENGYAYLM